MAKAMEGARATVPCENCRTLNRVNLGRIADRPKCGGCGERLLLDRPIQLTDRDFHKVVAASDVPVIVDFYADWCGPCKIMAPVLGELSRDHAGQVIVAKLDTDRHQQVASGFQIRGIPTLIGFAGGREVTREVGAVPRQSLETMIARTQAATSG